MNTTWLWIAGLLWIVVVSAHAEAETKAPDDKPSPPNMDKHMPSLRKPGFLFLELESAKVEEYAAFFQSAADYTLNYRKGKYVGLQTDSAEVMVIDPSFIPKGHPFHGKIGGGQNVGVGVEIGLVVADLDKSFAAAVKFLDANKGWSISSGIVARPWGVRDFRVLTPDGYYLRFTEAPKQ